MGGRTDGRHLEASCGKNVKRRPLHLRRRGIMKKRRLFAGCPALLLMAPILAFLPSITAAQEVPDVAAQEVSNAAAREASAVAARAASAAAAQDTPEGVVQNLYDMVTFPAGTTPDWEELRTLFLPETVIALRLSRDGLTVMDLDGFVEVWLRDIERFSLDESGFTERIIRTNTTEFGDIALVWVLYEAEIPGSGRPPQPGVDCIQLIRRDGRWVISAITNEVPTPDRAIPAVLRGEG
jgi:hypothetical protein